MTAEGDTGGQPPPTFLERHSISPVLFALMSLILVFLLYQGVGGAATVVLFGLKLTPDHATGLRSATLVAQVVLLLVPALLLTRLATRNSAAFLRLRPPRVSQLLIPFVGIFSLQQMLQVYMAFQERIPLPESLRSLLDELKQLIEETYRVLIESQSIGELMFVVLVIALVPAVAEEVFFRGMIQRSFEQTLGRSPGLWLTALIFAGYHLNPFSFVPLVALGLYLGFLVSSSESLWVSVAAHFYNNAVACVAVYLGLEENFIVTGDPAQLPAAELLVTFSAFSVVFLTSTYYFVRMTKSTDSIAAP